VTSRPIDSQPVSRIRPAGDARKAPASVHEAATRALLKGRRDAERIKAKRRRHAAAA
jgi:hypothetical protein